MAIRAGEAQPIIDHVPGVAPYEGPLSTDWAQQPAEGFQGDPSKVIGHPDNPFSGAGAAYAEHMQGGKDTQKENAAAQHAGSPIVEASGVELNTEVPAAAQQANNLSEAERTAIRQSVAKNSDLTKRFGSTYFNQPK